MVAFAEKLLLPPGFNVSTNQKIFDEGGHPLAEFDIEINGPVGSTTFSWLIECRDRPGHGTAPGAWIEQLVGRRGRFGFNKVTAVSTTGFAKGAIEYAKLEGIEIREVSEINPESFASWLRIAAIPHQERRPKVVHVSLLVGDDQDDRQKAALRSVIGGRPAAEVRLRAVASGQEAAVHQVCAAVINPELDHIFSKVVPNGEMLRQAFVVQYPNDADHYVIDTPAGPIRIRTIKFIAEFSIIETLLPLSSTSEYRGLSEPNDSISQVASFAPSEIAGSQWALEFHRLERDGQIHIVLRRVTEKKPTA